MGQKARAAVNGTPSPLQCTPRAARTAGAVTLAEASGPSSNATLSNCCFRHRVDLFEAPTSSLFKGPQERLLKFAICASAVGRNAQFEPFGHVGGPCLDLVHAFEPALCGVRARLIPDPDAVWQSQQAWGQGLWRQKQEAVLSPPRSYLGSLQLVRVVLLVPTLIWRYQESPPLPHKLGPDAVAGRLEVALTAAQARLAVYDLLRLVADGAILDLLLVIFDVARLVVLDQLRPLVGVVPAGPGFANNVT